MYRELQAKANGSWELLEEGIGEARYEIRAKETPKLAAVLGTDPRGVIAAWDAAGRPGKDWIDEHEITYTCVFTWIGIDVWDRMDDAGG